MINECNVYKNRRCMCEIANIDRTFSEFRIALEGQIHHKEFYHFRSHCVPVSSICLRLKFQTVII